MPRPKKVTEILADNEGEILTAPDELPKFEGFTCRATHPQLPHSNFERTFVNKEDAEAWCKRFNGKII